MESKGSLVYSKESIAGTYHQPDKSGPHLPALFIYDPF